MDVYRAFGLLVHIAMTIWRLVGIVTGTSATAAAAKEGNKAVEIREQGVPMPS